MKTSNLIVSIVALIIGNISFGQKDLSNYNDIDGVYVTSYWGNINAIGTDSNEQSFSIEAIYTDASKKPKKLDNLNGYITFRVENRTLYIGTKKPEGFESIDLNLKIPEHLFVELKLMKGGNIYVDNFNNGVEINILNGSVKAKRISKYALINAANGEIDAGFSAIDKSKPISLVTMNGGITVRLPEYAKRDVRLISRKNGYVDSDFKIESNEEIINLNKNEYSKNPIINTARINGGGALLFLSTENGPISIKKSKS